MPSLLEEVMYLPSGLAQDSVEQEAQVCGRKGQRQKNMTSPGMDQNGFDLSPLSVSVNVDQLAYFTCFVQLVSVSWIKSIVWKYHGLCMILGLLVDIVINTVLENLVSWVNPVAGDSHYVNLLKVSALDNLSNKVKVKLTSVGFALSSPQTNVGKSQGDLSALAHPGDLIVLSSHLRSTFPEEE